MKSKKCNKIAILFTVVGILSGYLIAFFNYKSSERIAKRSGHFDRPAPSVFMADNKGNRLGDNTFDHMIVFGDSFPERRIIRTRIPLIIINEGQRSATNVYLTFRYPKDGHMADSGENESFTYGRDIRILKSYNELGDFEFVSYHIPQLNPSEIFTLSEPIYLPRTEIRDTIIIPEISMEHKLTDVILAVPVTITLSGDDIETSDYTIEIVAFGADSFDHFVSRVDSYIFNAVKPYKSNKRPFRIFSKKQERTIMAEFIQPAYIEKNDERNIVFIQADQDTANLLYFSYK